MGIAIPAAPSANMMGQSLKSALGLPRDKRNWQIKKYAIITITITIMAAIPPRIGATVSKPNINKKKEKNPRKRAISTFHILFSLSDCISKLNLSSLATAILSRDKDLEREWRPDLGPGLPITERTCCHGYSPH